MLSHTLCSVMKLVSKITQYIYPGRDELCMSNCRCYIKIWQGNWHSEDDTMLVAKQDELAGRLCSHTGENTGQFLLTRVVCTFKFWLWCVLKIIDVFRHNFPVHDQVALPVYHVGDHEDLQAAHAFHLMLRNIQNSCSCDTPAAALDVTGKKLPIKPCRQKSNLLQSALQSVSTTIHAAWLKVCCKS